MSQRKKNQPLTSSLNRYKNYLDKMNRELSSIEQVPDDIKSKIEKLKSRIEQLYLELKQAEQETSDRHAKMPVAHHRPRMGYLGSTYEGLPEGLPEGLAGDPIVRPRPDYEGLPGDRNIDPPP